MMTLMFDTIGLLSVASNSFLVSITQRQRVAQIQGRPIYAVSNVAIIPLSSQADASRAITQARKDGSQGDARLDQSSSEDEMPGEETDEGETEIASEPASPSRKSFRARGISVSSIAEDVIGRQVRFGRFAANWLSRKNLGLPRPGPLSMDVPESPFDDEPSPQADADKDTKTPVPDQAKEGPLETKYDQATELLPKLVRYTKLIFSSHNFFFAYDYDLTRPISAQEARNGHQPLYKVVDPLVCSARVLLLYVHLAD